MTYAYVNNSTLFSMDELEISNGGIILTRGRRKLESLHTGSRTLCSLGSLYRNIYPTRLQYIFHNIRHRSSFLLPLAARYDQAGCNPALCTTPEDAYWD